MFDAVENSQYRHAVASGQHPLFLGFTLVRLLRCCVRRRWSRDDRYRLFSLDRRMSIPRRLTAGRPQSNQKKGKDVSHVRCRSLEEGNRINRRATTVGNVWLAS